MHCIRIDRHSLTQTRTFGAEERIESNRIGSRFCNFFRFFFCFGAAAPAKWFVARFTTDLPAAIGFAFAVCYSLFSCCCCCCRRWLLALAVAIALAEIGDRRSLLAHPPPPSGGPIDRHFPFCGRICWPFIQVRLGRALRRESEQLIQSSPNNRNRTEISKRARPIP